MSGGPGKGAAEGDASEPLSVGALVALRADPDRSGPIIAELASVGGLRRFRVYHSPALTRDYFEDQLQRSGLALKDEWKQRLLEHSFAEVPEFRARLTATRLNNPQVDHIYSLKSSRIQSIPFQFKPILRLLRAERPRLLVADDVGVGKTIEAGLILKELSTRQALRRVLVLCPKALTVKWRAEMLRFDEHFRVLSSESLRYCLDETDAEGEWPEEFARCIAHYELFRMEHYLVGADSRRRRHPGLLELDPPPQFNLVIADEAHHLRTPGTSSHQLIDHLCLTAEAVLMLTATPVQIHRDNLYTLLHLLRPELFPDKEVFQEVLEPNQYITAAGRLLRAGAAAGEGWVGGVLEAVEAAGRTNWGRTALQTDPRYQEVLARLATQALDDQGRVRTIRDLEELHSLSHVMNRTRRRDIGRFTIREPHTVSVPFTPEQRALYDAAIEFRRDVLLLDYPPGVVRLILDTLERQAASCVNALGSTIDKFLEGGGLSLEDLTDDPEGEDAPIGLPSALASRARALSSLAAALPDEDPKFDRLLQIISMALNDSEGPDKVLVFAYFMNTIDYLQRRLREAGIRVGVVTGRIDDDERESLRDRFRLDRGESLSIDVLLSSEVGCEGLDYEFCDRLINYDIPWNPMRIEQRIGRIDRFGQRSDKVLIFNFITPDTVEERVFFRCFERLGLFRDTVGDLEEVLGDMVQDLNRVALDPSLSAEQVEMKARQIADNAIRLSDEQRRLDLESGDLIGLDDAFTEEVKDVIADGRFIAEEDLRILVDTFLQQPFLRGSLGKEGGRLHRLRLPESGRRELLSRVRALGRPGNVSTSFWRTLESASDIILTFDQATAAERRDIDFLTPVHPLARAAAAYWDSRGEPLVGAFSVQADGIAPGLYLFVSEVWETIAVTGDLHLTCLATSLAGGVFAEGLSRELLRLLAEARPFTSDLGTLEPDLVEAAFGQLDSISDARRREAIRALEVSNELVLNRRLASLESFHEHRLRRAREELASATEAKIIRMKTSELARVQADHETTTATLERARRVEVISRRVAAGLVEVIDVG